LENRASSMLYSPIKFTSIKTIPFLSESRLYLESKLGSLEESTEVNNTEESE
jgi:hypothetical protein